MIAEEPSFAVRTTEPSCRQRLYRESTSRRVVSSGVRDVTKGDAVSPVVGGEHADGVLTQGTHEMLRHYGLNVDVKRVVRHWDSSLPEENPQRPGVRGRGGSHD